MALAEPPRTDEPHRWCEWVARRGIDPAWIRELARAGGSETWYVVERPVPATEWLRSFDTISGRAPSVAAFGRPGALCRCGVLAGGADHQASVLTAGGRGQRSGSTPQRKPPRAGFHGVTRA